jgi:glycine/D-amino acid oxidase-like deaminating enzyme
MVASSAGVVIVGGGLSGSLLALELRELGAAVTLIDAAAGDGSVSATAISYGAIPGWPLAATPLARLAAGASRRWRGLQRRHGPLGWQPRALRLHGPNPWLHALGRLGVLPFAQVDTATLSRRLPEVLAAAGVTLRSTTAEAIRPQGRGWLVALRDGTSAQADQLVLAAGARCRELWPDLPKRLRCSWAAVLELGLLPKDRDRHAAWLPQGFTRLALERRALELQESSWVVDPGLVPWGSGALLGQHTWIAPGGEAVPPPPADGCAWQLREALAEAGMDGGIATGVLRQAAVAFCTHGGPLVQPVAAAPGLWLFTGFSGGFAQVPVLAPLLAQRLVGSGQRAARAQRRLQQLGVWPMGADSGS